MTKKDKPVVAMIGLGYIGLPTAALVASRGLKVIGVDVNPEVVNTINKGEIHIVEPDLAGLVRKVVEEKTLETTTTMPEADVYVVAVPTPTHGHEHIPDLTYVEAAIRHIAPRLRPGNLVIIESTSPVGTTEKMYELIRSERPDLEGHFYMAYCPERVLPGKVLYELQHNDRAIGGIDEDSTREAISFYRHFVKAKLYPTNARTAEMVKLVENASRDVQIAFANELSLISDKAGIDVWELIDLANKHPRVNILRPGTGVGGHCIAVDPWFIVHDYSNEARLIRTAREINNYKTLWAAEKVKNAALAFELKHGRKPLVAAMGLAFKPDIDDLRESPALALVRMLQAQGLDVVGVEPNLKHDRLDDLPLLPATEAVHKADIVAFLVAHTPFKDLEIPEGKEVLDFVNAIPSLRRKPMASS